MYFSTNKNQINNQKSFIWFLKFFQRCRKIVTFSYPNSIIFEKWKNYDSQINFIQNLLNTEQPDLISFSDLPKSLVSLDPNQSVKLTTLNPPSLQFWNSLEFIELLIELSEGNKKIIYFNF